MPGPGKRSSKSRRTRTSKRASSSSRKSRTSKKSRRKSEARWFHYPLFRFVVVAGLLAAVVALLIGLMVLFHYDRLAARYDLSAVGRFPLETEVFDATGARIGYLHGEDVGMPVPLESVSPHFLNALIAREDSRFYRHHGIDRYGLVRAWIRNAKE
ncbi:MAG: transglycosylase domain-containing protein, partial [Verrucomicrobiales bacterium]